MEISMRVAITGATGFLGRYLVRHLAGAEYQLRCWYRPDSDRGGFDTITDAIEWIPATLGDEAVAAPLVRGADAVVHGAVQWQGLRNRGNSSQSKPNVFFGVNLTRSLQLFQAACEAGASCFVFILTGSVHEVILADRPASRLACYTEPTHVRVQQRQPDACE